MEGDTHSYIHIRCRLRNYAINTLKISSIADLVCRKLRVYQHDLGVQFVSAAKIRRLNRRYRAIDQSTDVLSFPQISWPKAQPVHAQGARHGNSRKHVPSDVLGDLVISLNDAARNAKNIGQTLDREVGFLLVHGILHLCGHDHIKKKDEIKMLRAQHQLMALLESQGKKPLWEKCVRKTPQRGLH